jgi:hypothetical protein
MKKECYLCLRFFQPSWLTKRSPLAPKAAIALMSLSVAAALLLPCERSAASSKDMTVSGIQPLSDGIRLQLGTVLLVPDQRPAVFSFDKAKGQIGSAGDWAGAAVGDLLSTSTSEPILDLPLGAVTLIAAPVVAIKDAIAAKQRLTPEKLTECETNLLKAMSEMAGQGHFREWLMKAAGEQCQGRLITLGEGTDGGYNGVAYASVLQARVQEIRLERTGSRDTSYRLRIICRIRLARASDGAVWYDQPVEYHSGTCLFSDWTMPNAFQGPAETGYRLLAEQCVTQLLATTDRPVLAGPGHGRKPEPSWNAGFTSAGGQPPANPASITRVSDLSGDTGTLGIYSTGTVAHVVIQRLPDRSEAVSEALDDVRDMFGDWIEHPNPWVALPAIVAAIPVSLGTQGAAAVRGLSPNTLRQAHAELSQAANETRPHEQLALQVAQQLTPQTTWLVTVVRQPLPLGAEQDPELMHCAAHGTLAVLTGSQTAGGYLFGQGVATALEIHVEGARLAGKEGVNPKLALCVEARATVLRVRDGQALYSCPVHYRSQSRHFTTWAAHDAKLFREELRKCYQDLSTIIVNQLVNRGLVPPTDKPQAVFAQRG